MRQIGMNRVAKIVLGSMVLWGLVVSSPGSARADCIPDPRGGCRPIVPPPVGIYAVVPVETRLAHARLRAHYKGDDAYLLDRFQTLLANPAVSGLAVRVHWDTLNPDPPSDTDPTVGYQWNFLDDAVNAIQEWNAMHLTPKTIQLQITPGFFTPSWVFDQMTAAGYSSCDLPSFPSSSKGCGSASFADSEGPGTGASTPLPLPWNPVYQDAWATFLRALWQRYGAGTIIVSIDVAGPTSASTEMILPNETNDPGHAVPLWRALLKAEYTSHPKYLNTDKAFVKAWEDAIDTYESIFDGITLVATTGSGLPNFSTDCSTGCPIPSTFADDCDEPTMLTMDCAAEATIVAYFSDAAGDNRKATQTSGIKFTHAGNPNLGLSGVKWLAQLTASSPSPIPSTSPILGGGQFGTAFSKDPSKDGGPGATTAEEALYNELQVVFDGTTFGPKYGVSDKLGVSPSLAPSNFTLTGPAPLNYLQIYDTDIVYASNDAAVQDLLNKASQRILKIAESGF